MKFSGNTIYLDNNATTSVDPRVLDFMIPYFCQSFGNAASRSHKFGREAKNAVDEARSTIANLINAGSDKDIVFTSGATESINLALKGVAVDSERTHIITTQTEHKAVLDSCKRLEQSGRQVTYLPVSSDGLLDLEILKQAITKKTGLVSVMMANNETGVLQNIKAIGELCSQQGVYFHTDATQAVGKIPFDVSHLNIDLASFTAHKIYGPKGVGALYVNRRVVANNLVAQIDGGGHEGGYRSGTLNVPGIVGFAKALEVSILEIDVDSARITGLRNKLFSHIANNLDYVYLNGHPTQRLSGTLNLSFAYTDADSLLMEMPEVAVSSGSACTSAQVSPSHVLKALGISDELAQASIRFGIGRFNTEDEIDYVAKRCVKAVLQLRSMSPIYKFATLQRAA